MTVAELIEKLQNQDPNSDVQILRGGQCHAIETVTKAPRKGDNEEPAIVIIG